ncbi:MAG TPA: hypothetical protein PLJ27_07565 [Polyangiaceae bacterium]|nr:hypothetical protein [Polyangiaceae bacterium]
MKPNKPRVLVLSHRNIVNLILARCLWFEFEDILAQIDAVEILMPRRTKDVRGFDRGYRIAAKVAQYLPIALNPGAAVTTVEGEYDLFFTVCTFPTDLLYVNTLKEWRRKCKTAVCWLDEMYLTDLPKVKYVRTILSDFDHVIVSCSQVIDVVQKLIAGKCVFAVPAVDALAFCPYPDPPERFIDVLSIGRRRETLHAELIKAAQENKLTYFYDTISSYGAKYGLTTSNPTQHRFLLSNLLKRSKCFVTFPGRFDELRTTGGEEVIGARYFEGAAAGALMIGHQPQNQLFREFIFWPNAVIELDSHSAPIEKVIRDIVAQPTCDAHRRDNIVYSLLHHDWAYRWEIVLGLAQLPALSGLLDRKRRLKELSTLVQGQAPDPRDSSRRDTSPIRS